MITYYLLFFIEKPMKLLHFTLSSFLGIPIEDIISNKDGYLKVEKFSSKESAENYLQFILDNYKKHPLCQKERFRIMD